MTRNINTFKATREEGSVQLSQRLSRSDTVLYRFAYRNTTVSNLQVYQLLVPLLSQPVRIGIPAISYIQDRRDDPTDAHKGVYNSVDFGVSSGIFGSQSSFTRFLARNSTYHPITKRLVVSAVGQLRLAPARLETRHPQPVVPGSPATRFRASIWRRFRWPSAISPAAETRHRAFPENQAGPRDSSTGFPVGGQALTVFQHRAAFPDVRR